MAVGIAIGIAVRLEARQCKQTGVVSHIRRSIWVWIDLESIGDVVAGAFPALASAMAGSSSCVGLNEAFLVRAI